MKPSKFALSDPTRNVANISKVIHGADEQVWVIKHANVLDLND